MANPGEDKSDGLEIISIGKLYSGPWDKKYWSSSRGKDRYPYPVGYRALRTHNMVTYKMEINEGLKGPSFSIISSDGQSCSGQTPDIVWESLQKKGILRVKVLHGKRFSSKIDGIEFFGFKNAFVQRLLRELVATVGGTAEQSSLISSLGSVVSVKKHHDQHGEASADSNLLAHLEKPKTRGKRGRKPKTSSCIGKEGDNSHIKTSSEDHMHYDQSANTRAGFAGSMNLKTVVEEESTPCSAKDTSAQACQLSAHHSKVILEEKERGLDISDNLGPVEGSRDSCIGDETLDRFEDDEFQGFSSAMAAEDRKLPASEDTQDMKVMELFVPDTMDVFDDGTSDFPPNTQKGRPPDCAGESAAEYVSVPEGPMTAPNMEEEKCTSNTSGGKSDFDSVDQNIDKSMMELLLPRAIPLLKTFSRKKKVSKLSSENTSSRKKSKKENSGADCYRDASEELAPESHPGIPHSDYQKIPVQSIHAGSDALVVPDSVETEQYGSQADLATMDVQKSGPHSLGNPFGEDASTATRCSVISSSREKPRSIYEGQQNSTEKGRLITKSDLGCIPLDRSISPVNDKELHRYPEEKLAVQEVHFKDDLKTSTDPFRGMVDDNIEGISSSVQTEQTETSFKAWEAGAENVSLPEAPDTAILRRRHDGPLTESFIFRSFAGCAEESKSSKVMVSSEAQPANSSNLDTHKGDPFCAEATLEKRACSSLIEKNATSSIGFTRNTDSDRSQNLADLCAPREDHKSFLDPSDSRMQKSQACNEVELQRQQDNLSLSDFESCAQRQGTRSSPNKCKSVRGSNMNHKTDMGNNDKEENTFLLLGCYVHTLPVLSISLRVKDNVIFISALCGNVMDENKTLIVYTVSLYGEIVGTPSSIGHTPILVPTSTDSLGREIAVARSGLQFTPDGHGLVLLDSMKAPYCREGKLQCPCSTCRSNCLEKNGVKIVQVNHGHVSVVLKLKTVNNVHCVLVCEPNIIVSVEESGRLCLWVMNPTWSELMEECDLSASDCIFPCITELKRIPNRATLVLGHNGFGEFGLWDISRRSFVARFSSPTTSVSDFLPISIFRWQRQNVVSTGLHRKMDINGIIAATQTSLSGKDDSFTFVPEEGGDMAVWLLMSSAHSSSNVRRFQSSETKVNPVGSWGLALLVENKVILGSALDFRATAVGSSAGHGIIGTDDGLVHTWELSRGTKLRNIHSFRGAGVSCIATDDSNPSGPFAVAAGNQLILYLHSQNAC